MIVKDLTVRYGEKPVLLDFSIEIEERKITCILGPSGCGKTTLLNCIVGTVPYEGRIERKENRIGYVYQDPTLFPHLTVGKNIELVLKKRYRDKKERWDKVDRILKDVGLFAEKNAYPDTLSGGMAQRVSLARAFAYESDLLLLDEPFKGLDISLKKRLIDVFYDLYSKTEPTTVFVTHDVEEAIQLADTIIVLDGTGKIVYRVSLDDAIHSRDPIKYAPIRAAVYDSIR
ncbi:MAG: ATP-binding cassette domain-containing protein [Clostridia bacterium]|nr:ATP-binding cassette domain-containing protein [Clostridia bacterium]